MLHLPLAMRRTRPSRGRFARALFVLTTLPALAIADTDLSITKSGPGGVKPGESLVYTIVVTSVTGPDPVDATVTDLTPPGLTFVSNSGDCASPFPCILNA